MDDVDFKAVEDDLIDQLTKEMERERDADILYGLYRVSGWHEVKLTRWLDRDEAAELWDWRRDNVTGDCYNVDQGWLFELEQDAIMFALRWS